jgi:hypothetical protein
MLLRYMQVEQVKTAPESHGDDETETQDSRSEVPHDKLLEHRPSFRIRMRSAEMERENRD